MHVIIIYAYLIFSDQFSFNSPVPVLFYVFHTQGCDDIIAYEIFRSTIFINAMIQVGTLQVLQHAASCIWVKSVHVQAHFFFVKYSSFIQHVYLLSSSQDRCKHIRTVIICRPFCSIF